MTTSPFMTPSPIVEMRGVSITFPGVKALDAVDFRLLPGEVHALMGENGAGKSTLIKALTGVYAIDAGQIVIDGEERRLHGTADAQTAGISVVYQEVNLCPNLTIGENVMLGHEVRGPFGIRWKATHRGRRAGARQARPAPSRHPAAAVVAVVGDAAARGDQPGDGHRFEGAHPRRADVEPRCHRGRATVRASSVNSVIGAWRSCSCRTSSTRCTRSATRITILRNGGYVGEFLTAELDRTDLIAKMIGKELSLLRSIDAERHQRRADRTDDPVLAATSLGRKGAIAPTDFEIHTGEVIGFAGLLGSGRTELARLLYGADKSDSGTVIFHGERGGAQLARPPASPIASPTRARTAVTKG